jgi:AAA domain
MDAEAAFLGPTGEDDLAGVVVGMAPARGVGLLGEPVSLVSIIPNGIPEPEYVPGCHGFLRRGKRYLVPAPAGGCKSLLFEVIATNIVAAGGTVVILDVENGADEYARRLQCILDANDHDGTLADACDRRLIYYEWPKLNLDWSEQDWRDAVTGADRKGVADQHQTSEGADLVIFDSSRWLLSGVGLEENQADDYAAFATAFLLPLSKAGITTIVLDNTGHAEKDRARGSKAKDDLNEVVYTLQKIGEPDIDNTGIVKLALTRQRFGGVHRQLQARIGGGVYEQPQPVEQPSDERGNFRPTILMGRVADYLQDNPGASLRAIKTNVKGDNNHLPTALHQLIEEGYVDADHRLIKPFQVDEDPAG